MSISMGQYQMEPQTSVWLISNSKQEKLMEDFMSKRQPDACPQ